MRSLMSPFAVVVVGALAAISIVGGCSTPNTGAANPSRGERFFQTKCNACHPNGGQGAGPPIDLAMAPDFLERGKTSGRHAVPEADWEPLMAHLQQRLGGGAAVAAPTAVAGGAVAAPVAVAPVVAAAPAGDPAQGQPYFQNKCAKCHPNGNRIAGKTVPGVLQSGGSGKHGIPADQFDHVVAYLTTIGAVRAGGAPAVAAQPAAPVAAAPAIAAASTSGDASAGGGFFQTKCAKCHPGGNKITGKTVPGVLQAGGSGKHGVPSEHFDNLLAYLTTIGAVRAGSAPVAAAPTGGTATSSPAPTTVPSSGVIPMNAGMVNCSCACQCPANTPQEAMPAACLCQCSCPR